MTENAFDVLPPAARTLPAMLRRQAEAFGARPLLSIAGTRWTHADAAAIVARRAAALQRAGVQRGERVALMCGNRVECLETFLACGWIGAVAVPINTASMGPQIQYFLANSGARLLLIDDAFIERLRTADLSQTALAAIWTVGEGDAAADHCGDVPVEAFPAPGIAAEPAEVQPGDTLAILYTSGTTGPAKGVICPHAQYYWWGVHTARILDVGRDDVLCTTLPLFHINALNTFAQAALTGAGVVYAPRFSASGFWSAMRDCGATVVYLLGAMVPILLAQPEGAHERAHRVRIGLGPGVPASAGEAFARRTGVGLLEGYGSTETNFVIATRPDAPRSGVMGWLQPGFEARVADATDAALPDGEAGELLLRADEPFAFATGYFGMPDKTVEAWRNLWFHTGDRVLREADGAFRFIDRLKDAIRRRGENISSYEVEQVLLGHPSVAAVAVYPVGSELAEDEVMAALVARPGVAVDMAELVRYCETRLPYFAVPRYIELFADLPRTENGKVQKFRLRERGVTAATWDRGPASRPPPRA
ncbi:ATP-dependent acyl-CoA ligase [Variovorax sp. PBL-E5]|uniref:ATP-dependent acyl-CoA ligase n=1 Tax=Variovorax sp. PBL-E5 TaxID=434014 RepID=UPI00131948BD|nr:ATP-dependent acyl-CoA ligase [Variovorax sp. PBL-E5]VTU26991.1 Long-chain-fatty-acid--CoA ligase [Variovorax sp. PBL-E5]